MAEYIVKVGFWLRAYQGIAIDADFDSEAIEKAKAATKKAMESSEVPDHIEIDERRQGIIAYIDCKTLSGLRSVTTNLEFDADRIGDEAT